MVDKLTPKEKAENILIKMSSQTYQYQPYAGAHYSVDEIGYEAGKKCAVITIDEKIESLNTFSEYWNIQNGEWYKDELKELESIKTELNKL